MVIYALSDFQGISKLESFRPKIPSKLLDMNGDLISEFFIQKRRLINFDQIPKHLVQAFVAMEDNRFYDHLGVDPRSIIRAFFVNMLAGRVKEGGSTITQQLAKVVLTTREKTYVRKIKEAIISLQIERKYSKNEILTLYFNQIYLGHGAYGVEAASNFYFGKTVSEINIAEAALLAALPSAPNIYSPLRNPHKSRERHKLVLKRMVENGFISISQAEEALSNFWTSFQERIGSPSVSTWGSRIDKAPYFTEYIRRRLEPLLGKEKLYTGGLNIYSTLDLKSQMAAQMAIAERLKIQRSKGKSRVTPKEEIISNEFSGNWQVLSNLFSLPVIRSRQSNTQLGFSKEFISGGFDEIRILNLIAGNGPFANLLEEFSQKNDVFVNRDQVEGALIAIDYKNGEIRAMVGGSSFRSDNQFNRTIQMKRQTGSSFKPFVYSTAMELKLFTPATLVDDTPLLYLDEMGDYWTPENYSGEYLGPIRLRRALELSRNVISVKVAEKIGIDKVIEKAGELIGIYDKKEVSKRFPNDLSVSLGSVDISPIEMARAYAVFARGGTAVIPYGIRKITSRDGEIILDPKADIQKKLDELKKMGKYRIFSHSTATLINSMLKSASTRGTGRGARSGYNKMVAGKTGTTNNFKDAWYVGFNHTMVAAVWFGFDKHGLTLRGQSGGGLAAPTFGRFMALAQGHLPDKPFGFYGGVVTRRICSKTGLLPSALCPISMDEIFLPGTEPKESCSSCSGAVIFDKKISDIGDQDLFLETPNVNINTTKNKKDPIFNLH